MAHDLIHSIIFNGELLNENEQIVNTCKPI